MIEAVCRAVNTGVVTTDTGDMRHPSTLVNTTKDAASMGRVSSWCVLMVTVDSRSATLLTIF